MNFGQHLLVAASGWGGGGGLGGMRGRGIGGKLPLVDYMKRLCAKGAPFQAEGIRKCRDLKNWGRQKVREL